MIINSRPVGIHQQRRLRQQAINLVLPKQVKAWGNGLLRIKSDYFSQRATRGEWNYTSRSVYHKQVCSLCTRPHIILVRMGIILILQIQVQNFLSYWYRFDLHYNFSQNVNQFAKYLYQIGIFTGKWLECSPMTRKTCVQSQVESYWRLKKWYMMPPCLTLSIIRYGSRGSILGKD